MEREGKLLSSVIIPLVTVKWFKLFVDWSSIKSDAVCCNFTLLLSHVQNLSICIGNGVSPFIVASSIGMDFLCRRSEDFSL